MVLRYRFYSEYLGSSFVSYCQYVEMTVYIIIMLALAITLESLVFVEISELFVAFSLSLNGEKQEKEEEWF